MASAAAGSCFSAAAAAANCPKLCSKLDGGALRVSCPGHCRRNLLPPLSSTHLRESLFLPTAAQRPRLARLALAAVAQEEVSVEEEEEEAGDEVPSDRSKKLYFGNLPYNCDSAQLAGIIQEYANPEMVEVLYDRETGRSRGFAFVTMNTLEDCEAVIENLDGSQYGGRTLRVNFSDKPRSKAPLYPETQFKLFVGNLSWSVTSESLTEMFQEYGDVVGARVLYDGDTGKSRGYGFVCYSSKEEMENALHHLNGVELEGRSMRISLALGKRS